MNENVCGYKLLDKTVTNVSEINAWVTWVSRNHDKLELEMGEEPSSALFDKERVAVDAKHAHELTGHQFEIWCYKWVRDDDGMLNLKFEKCGYYAGKGDAI